MSIEIVCRCGARMRAKDEYAGLKATCPVCKALLAIEVPIDTPPTPENAVNWDGTNDPRIRVKPKPPSHTAPQRKPVVWLLVGSAACGLAMLTVAFVLWAKHVEQQRALARIAVEAEQARRRAEFENAMRAANNAPKPTKAKLTLSESAVEYAASTINAAFAGNKIYHEIRELEVNRMPQDERRQFWLWGAVALISATDAPGSHHTIHWRSRFRFGSDGGSWEVYRELKDESTGKVTVVPCARSEWTDRFEKSIRMNWGAVLKTHEENAARLRWGGAARERDLAGIRQRFLMSTGLTVTELMGILDRGN